MIIIMMIMMINFYKISSKETNHRGSGPGGRVAASACDTARLPGDGGERWAAGSSPAQHSACCKKHEEEEEEEEKGRMRKNQQNQQRRRQRAAHATAGGWAGGGRRGGPYAQAAPCARAPRCTRPRHGTLPAQQNSYARHALRCCQSFLPRAARRWRRCQGRARRRIAAGQGSGARAPCPGARRRRGRRPPSSTAHQWKSKHGIPG